MSQAEENRELNVFPWLRALRGAPKETVTIGILNIKYSSLNKSQLTIKCDFTIKVYLE
jgi:hypothetical protein